MAKLSSGTPSGTRDLTGLTTRKLVHSGHALSDFSQKRDDYHREARSTWVPQG